MITKLFIIVTLFLSLNIFGQEEKKLNSKDGIDISYQLIMEEEGSKKDKYILIVNAVNNSNEDLYYPVTLIKNTSGELSLPPFNENLGFTKILVRNSTGLFGDGQSVGGEQTTFFTTKDEIIFIIKKGNVYSAETTFKVKNGAKPLITNTFTKTFNDLSTYDLKLTAAMVTGDFISTCGNIRINLNVLNDTVRGEYLIQTTNGNQFIWIRKSENSFARENSNDYTLTFNKKNNSFLYSTADGMSCDWKRE